MWPFSEIFFSSFICICWHFNNYQHLNLGCPAVHKLYFDLSYFGVVIYNVFASWIIMFLLDQNLCNIVLSVELSFGFINQDLCGFWAFFINRLVICLSGAFEFLLAIGSGWHWGSDAAQWDTSSWLVKMSGVNILPGFRNFYPLPLNFLPTSSLE
jgi:hypothetical protein